jgi:hypothetical protein
MPSKPNERVADWSQCPMCVELNKLNGGEKKYADSYFNTGDHPKDTHGQLWAVCETHNVRWYVTRALIGLAPFRPDLMALPEVVGIDGWR